MTEWTADRIARLYELHKRYVDALRRDVIEVNRSLGSPKPEKTGLTYLTRAQFRSLLNGRSGNREIVRLWVRRIIRGNEHEFPDFQAAG
jgi:hypothetical protein